MLPPIRVHARSATIRGHRPALAIRKERGTKPRACAAVELREDDRRARAAPAPLGNPIQANEYLEPAEFFDGIGEAKFGVF